MQYYYAILHCTSAVIALQETPGAGMRENRWLYGLSLGIRESSVRIAAVYILCARTHDRAGI